MTDKQLVLDVVSKLPEDSTIHAIRKEIELLDAIRRGEQAADAGRVVEHNEVKKCAARWQ